jgi:hypothetical protein
LLGGKTFVRAVDASAALGAHRAGGSFNRCTVGSSVAEKRIAEESNILFS